MNKSKINKLYVEKLNNYGTWLSLLFLLAILSTFVFLSEGNYTEPFKGFVLWEIILLSCLFIGLVESIFLGMIDFNKGSTSSSTKWSAIFFAVLSSIIIMLISWLKLISFIVLGGLILIIGWFKLNSIWFDYLKKKSTRSRK